MKAVSLALLYLGSVSFFGVEAAKLDLARRSKRQWTVWEQRRARRDLMLPATTLTAAQAADPVLWALMRTPEAKGEPGTALTSRPEKSHIRVKRYDQHNHSLSKRVGCRLGTCTTQNLAYIIYHMTDKDKDSTPPAKKLTAQGYGRRRRRRRSLSGSRRAAAASGDGAVTLSRLLRALAASPRAPAQPR